MPAVKKPAAKPVEAAGVMRFIVDGKPYEIDSDNLSWGELVKVEQYFNASFEDLKSASTVLALAGLAVMRKDPSRTFEELGRLLLDGITRDETKPSRPTSTPANGGGQS